MSRTVRLGAFIFGTLAILVLGIFIIGSKKYLFSSTYSLRAQFANVAGLQAGADVLVGGVHSGTIRTIELPHKPGEQVTVLMELNNSTHEIVKRDSIASIQTEGLLGSQFVSVSFGSAGKLDVKDGDLIESVPPLEIAALFDKANGLLDSGKVALDNIANVSGNLNSVTSKIDHGQGTVGALVNDKSLYNDLQGTASTARSTVIAAQAGVVDFQENMEALKHNFLLKGYFKNRGYEDSSELEKNEVVGVPEGAPIKEFTVQAKEIFDKQDSAKLKNQKQLNAAGEFLASGEFGVAIVIASSSATGDAEAGRVLAEARAMNVRDYLVGHYAFDDTKLKTVALGKQSDSKASGEWGLIRIDIYPNGTAMPPSKSAPTK